MILLSFCTFPWWLAWLLPFLLGLALGWAIWSKYKSRVAELEGDINNLNTKINDLDVDLGNCRHKTAELEGDISIAKGKMREAEDALSTYLTTKGKPSDKSLGKSTPNESSSATSAGITAAASLGSATSSKNVSGKNSGSKSLYSKLSSNNLQIIEGIGPKMEEVLKENKISNWVDLASQSEKDLRGILDKYGDKYKIIDVATWQQQAKYASDGDFDGLITMQKSIDGGSAKTLSPSDSKLEKHLVKIGVIKRYKQDDLKAIEGIGPKIESILHKSGIKTWRALADSTSESIRKVLDDAGSRFKLADPGTWPKQAELAANGEFDKLKEYQDSLQGGK